MEQIGKVFRQLRESRNISLRQATGGQFSPSMLSRFETGQSELSVEKFLFALENISASVEEILFLARGFQYDTDSELRKEITDVLEPKNIAPLEDLYRREYQKHAHSHNKQKHILNAIIIKSYMKSMDERVELTAEEGKVLHFMIICFLPRSGESMNSIYFQSVLHFYLFLFLLDMYEKWYVNLIF